MALLSEPTIGSAHPLAEKLLKVRKFILLIALIGPATFLTFASMQQYNLIQTTHISENALLPGLVDETFSGERAINRVAVKLQATDGDITKIRDVVKTEFEAAGIEIYSQHFRDNQTGLVGTNMYAIVRAIRATPAEAILITVPLNPQMNIGTAVSIAFALHAKEQVYWARDLIFLFVDSQQPLRATSAWIRKYNGKHIRNMEVDPIESHSGTIVGGVVLEMSSAEFTHMHVRYTGPILPNLDLFNMFIRVVEKHDVRTFIHNANYGATSTPKVLWRSLLGQAFSPADGIHSILNQYRVHSVTLRTYRSPRNHPKRSTVAAEILEGGVRSLNNVLEKLHASYFFYLLGSPHHFLPLAVFYGAAGAQLGAFLLQYYAAWYDSTDGWALLKRSGARRGLSIIVLATAFLGQRNGIVTKILQYVELDVLIQVVVVLQFVLPVAEGMYPVAEQDHVLIRQVLYMLILVATLVLSLINYGLAICVGTYILLMSVIVEILPKHFTTQFLFGVLCNPQVFYAGFVAVASHLGIWPDELPQLNLDSFTTEKLKGFVLAEVKRISLDGIFVNATFIVTFFFLLVAHSYFIAVLSRCKVKIREKTD